MGLADDYFWNLTPLLFGMLSEQHRQRERRKDLRAGLVAAAVYNTARTKKTDKVWMPGDFFGEAKSNGVQTEHEMMLAMDAWVVRTKGLN